MATMKRNLPDRMDIILALAKKDIVDALKNKVILSIMIGVALLMLQGQALPLLLKISKTPQVVIYDEGESSLISHLRGADRLRVIAVDSEEELEEVIGEASGDAMGVLIPATFMEGSAAGTSPKVEGYYPYWMNSSKASELKAVVEAALTSYAGRGVVLDIEGHAVYPRPDAGGQPFTTTLVLVLVIVIISVLVAPFLMMEEKESRSLAALLVSPASISDVVLGKALAGLSYGMVAAAVVLVFNHAFIVDWWVAILAAICGSLFAVGLGLLLGTASENMASMGLWLTLSLVVLMIPLVLPSVDSAKIPEALRAFLNLLPTVPLVRAFRLSLTFAPPLDQVLLNLGLVLVWAGLMLGAVGWLVRRMDR
jgi:ABC-2 type transport system permease protein